MTCHTLGQSRTMPNAMVAIKTRVLPSALQKDRTTSFIQGSVHLVYISTKRFLANLSEQVAQ